MRIVAVIPARGGSKGVIRKNVRPMAGKPLIGWTIEAALAARGITRTLVSTDDQEIREIANSYGDLAPFERPQELAVDSALTFPVVEHAVAYLEELGETYDAVMLLQPTCPLRTSEQIDAAIRLFSDTGADSVVTVIPVGGWHPFRMKRIVAGDRLINFIDQGFEDMRPRQELPPVYIRDGSIYLIKRHVLDRGTLVYGDVRAIVNDPDYAVNIDQESDFLAAEEIMRRIAKD